MRKANPTVAGLFAVLFLCASLMAPSLSFAARSVNSSGAVTEAAADEEQTAPAEAVEAVQESEEAPRAISPREAARPKSPAVRAREAEAPSAAAEPAPPANTGSTHRDYVLGSGDKIRITVFGEEDLSGPFEVSSTGMVSMPLIGQVRAAGNTISRLEAIITEKLRDGYMKDPRVSVEVQGYRPFFIVGEVMKPGRYDYVNGMTVITAVALAGGYTYRADKDGITLKHAGANAKEAPVKEDASVIPGDVIRVPERFF
jgi:protein involved in polysaccharide export with SLBB domain